MGNTDSLDRVSAPARLRLVLVAWTGGSVLLAMAAPTGASLIAESLTILTVLYAYQRLGHGLWRYPARAIGPEIQRMLPPDPRTPEEARHFIEREFAAAQRGRRLALIMFGFANLTQFTQERGPVAADNAVVEFGRLLQRLTRRMNVSARYGWRAESFLSVLSDADASAAQAVVERVRRGVAELDVPMPEIAAGVAVYRESLDSPEHLVAEAERALAAARAELERR